MAWSSLVGTTIATDIDIDINGNYFWDPANNQIGNDATNVDLTFSMLRQLGVNIPWVGSPSVVAVSSTKLAGPALYGTYGVADYAEESSEASKAFGKAYREAYKTAPDNQSAWPYDAVTILSAAINKAGSTDPGKIREALLATKKTPGAEGEYNFDQNGDGVSNVDARPHTDPEEIRGLLVQQVLQPVLWEQTMRYLLGEGIDRFVEIGPGRVLAGLLKRVQRRVECRNVSA